MALDIRQQPDNPFRRGRTGGGQGSRRQIARRHHERGSRPVHQHVVGKQTRRRFLAPDQQKQRADTLRVIRHQRHRFRPAGQGEKRLDETAETIRDGLPRETQENEARNRRDIIAMRRLRRDQEQRAGTVLHLFAERRQATRSGEYISQFEKGMLVDTREKNRPLGHQNFKRLIQIFLPHRANLA